MAINLASVNSQVFACIRVVEELGTVESGSFSIGIPMVINFLRATLGSGGTAY